MLFADDFAVNVVDDVSRLDCINMRSSNSRITFMKDSNFANICCSIILLLSLKGIHLNCFITNREKWRFLFCLYRLFLLLSNK